MQHKSCNVISDLLPLYVDGVCSKESCKLVEEHLKECQSCKKILEDMSVDLNTSAKNDNFKEDANIIKKVRKRIWIERIVIALLALFVTGIITFSILLSLVGSEKNMNDVIDFNNISIEEDTEGNLWLIRSGNGTMASRIFPEVYDTNGNLMISSDKIINQLEDNNTYQIRVVFYESPLIYTMQNFMNSDVSSNNEEKSLFLSKEALEKYNEIVIQKSDGTKKILWQKEK